MINFITNAQNQDAQIYDDILNALKMQHQNGNINTKDLQKILQLAKNTKRLKNALTYL